jgi:hypothetical protein
VGIVGDALSCHSFVDVLHGHFTWSRDFKSSDEFCNSHISLWLT